MVLVVTAVVLIENPFDIVAPEATVTVAGTDATAGLELVNVTVNPAEGAGPSILMVFPVTVEPPLTEDTDSCTANGVATFTISCASCETP